MTNLGQERFSEMAGLIRGWRRPLLIPHAKADGDALGSIIAMRSLMQSWNANPIALLFEPVPDRYALFHRFEPCRYWDVDCHAADLEDVDGVVLLDTCSLSQLEPIAEWLNASKLPKVAVDHHVTRDDLVDLALIDESAAATCLVLLEWAHAMDWSLAPAGVEALFVGIAMDTGWFRHSNTDQRVLSAVADLVARGAKPHELHQQLFQQETPARVRLLGAALGSLEILAEGRLSVMTLTPQTIADAGARLADTEDIINEPLRIGSVVVSLLLVETEDHRVRVGFRSKPPLADQAGGTQFDIDVAKIAASLGGGGHKRAAGARIAGTLAEARAQVVALFEQTLKA